VLHKSRINGTQVMSKVSRAMVASAERRCIVKRRSTYSSEEMKFKWREHIAYRNIRTIGKIGGYRMSMLG
jgi:hypothetical protein